MQKALPQSVIVQHGSHWRSFALGYAFLAVFAVASRRAIGMTALEFGAFALVLALPAMAALWHQSTVRHLVRMHQFAPGSGLRWLASRRLLSVLVRAALALLLTGTVLMQSVLFGRLEWSLMALLPLFYVAISSALGQHIERQFSLQVYARRWVFWATQGLATALLTLVWLFAHIAMAEAPSQVVAEVVLDLQQRWVGSPSGLIKWALDASAWVQATIDALEWAPNSPRWELVVSLFLTPLAAFGYLSLTLSGLSLPISEVRRTVGEPLTEVDVPPLVGPVRAAIWAAVATVGVMFYFQAIAAVENLIGSRESPFAVQRLPDCERIGRTVYRVNTIKMLEAFMTVMNQRIAGQQIAACSSLTGIESMADKGVDAYLDWYFSIGADWARTINLLTGGVDELLESKFHDLVLSDPKVKDQLAGVKDHFDSLTLLGVMGKSGAAELLEKQRLVLTDQQCKVVQELSADPWAPKFDWFSARLATGSGSGVLAGVIAAKITSKVMAKASMKLASKVLLKAAAQKGATKVGSAMAGAAIGTVLSPGVGTVAGAVVGVVAGLAVGVGVDIGTLAIEEKLTRNDMKIDLLSAFTETLQPYRTAFACGK